MRKSTLPRKHVDYTQAMIATKQGNREAFNELAASIEPILKRYLMKKGPCPQDVLDDVIQTTLMKAWVNSTRFNPEKASGVTWLFTIAKRSMIDHKTSTWRRKKTAFSDFVTNQEPADIERRRFEDETRSFDSILNACPVLTPKQREVITLLYLRSLTLKQIAAALGIPIGTAKYRLNAGLLLLRKNRQEMATEVP